MRGSIAVVAACLSVVLPACYGSSSRLSGDATAHDVPPADVPASEDSDGDTITDVEEGRYVPGHPVDTDGDGTPDYLDLDSDDDSLGDAGEAGDADTSTRTRDSDGDGTPDFRDTDSDADCLGDRYEAEIGTDPTDPDTDGDGVTDHLEMIFGSDPLDPADRYGPEDVVVFLPYGGGAETRRFGFETDIRVADVYFLIDTTGSMSDAIENVATSLAGTIVPALRAAFPDVRMGVGHFNDVPAMDYGDENDEPYWNVVSITDDVPAVQAGLDGLYGEVPWGGGADGPESHVIALWCMATGEGFTDCSSDIPPAECVAPAVGYPCFRPEALPVIVHVSDAAWHNDHTGANPYECTSTGFVDAADALNRIGAKYIGISVGIMDLAGYAAMQETCVRTGSLDSMGAPLLQSSGSGSVSTAIVDTIYTLARFEREDMHAVARDEPGDPADVDYDATTFVEGARPAGADPSDGFDHMDGTWFYGVRSGTTLSFDVSFRNVSVPPRPEDRAFKVWIELLGSGGARHDQAMAWIVVPGSGCR